MQAWQAEGLTQKRDRVEQLVAANERGLDDLRNRRLVFIEREAVAVAKFMVVVLFSARGVWWSAVDERTVRQSDRQRHDTCQAVSYLV